VPRRSLFPQPANFKTMTPVANLNRRVFLQSLSATALVAAASPAWAAASTAIGVQLYTLRADLANDLVGTLAAVRKIGIENVEAFPAVYNHPPEELRKIIADAGLKCPSGHFDYDKLDEGLDYGQKLGLSFVVCSALPGALRNADGFVQAAKRFNELGAKAKSMGMKLGFHNHNFEFAQIASTSESVPPTTGLNLLLSGTDPKLVYWEEDCYWVAQSGNDPLAYLKQYEHRVPLLHIKDRQPNAPVTFVQGKQSQFFTEVGTGTIAWPPILKIARETGALIFIEQDVTAIPALESLAISYRNLRKYLG